MRTVNERECKDMKKEDTLDEKSLYIDKILRLLEKADIREILVVYRFTISLNKK